MTRIFISYAPAEAEWAEAIDRGLQGHGFDVFRDVRGIRGGHDFTSEIEDNRSVHAHRRMLECELPG